MTDNTKMREALINFGQENPVLDLDFRLHTHGKYLTQEKAIVASRAFKAGAAWQAAQSVPVVGEPVAWGVKKRYEDNVWFISDSRFTAQHYANQYAHRIGAEPDQVVIPLFDKPTTSIPAAELASLREKAAMVDELQKRAERMQKALSDIAEWTDRYTTPGHPVSTIARAAMMRWYDNTHTATQERQP